MAAPAREEEKEPAAPPAGRLASLPIEVRVDLVWAASVVVGAAAIFALLDLVQGVAVPVLLALGLAYAFDPLVDRFEARGWSRSAAIALLGGGVIVVLGGLLAWLVPAVVEQAARLPSYLQTAATRLLPLAEQALGRALPGTLHEAAAEAGGWASSLVSKAGPAVGAFLLRAAGSTASAASFVIGLGLVPVFLFYFLRDFDRMKARAAELVPHRHRAQIASRFGEIDAVCAAFLRGQATVALILGGVYALGLTLAGVKLGLLIGVLAGIASLVPFAGVAVGVALSAVAVLVDWHDGSLWVAALGGLTFVVGQVLEGYVITPRIVGEKVGLSPVAVMLAVLAFGELLGFVGLLLAVPLAAVLQVVVGVLLGRYRTSAWYRRREEGRNSDHSCFSD